MMLRTKTTSPEYRAEVEMIGATLKMGETARLLCPKCRGGSSGEKSFICSRDVGSVVLYHCFRATCTFSGRIGMAPSLHDHTSPRVRARRAMEHPVEPLDKEDIEMFRAVFGITPDRDTYWCPSMERYAHRVYGPIGQNRGWVLRDYAGHKVPKALAYPYSDLAEPFISWYYPNKELESCVVVVEDMLSAKKVADSGFKAVALLGTWIDIERAYEIADISSGRAVHLALDEGTVATMLSYRDKFECIFGPAKVWLLKDDLKYIERNRIRKAVLDGELNFRIDAEVEVKL